MNQEIKQKWVEALRSGMYTQGKGQLREGDAFCCLGVLCDIHSKETGTEWSDAGAYCYVGLLSPEVQEWAGVTSNGGGYIRLNGIGGMSLPTLNDELNYSFEQIADLIEEQL